MVAWIINKLCPAFVVANDYIPDPDLEKRRACNYIVVRRQKLIERLRVTGLFS